MSLGDAPHPPTDHAQNIPESSYAQLSARFFGLAPKVHKSVGRPAREQSPRSSCDPLSARPIDAITLDEAALILCCSPTGGMRGYWARGQLPKPARYQHRQYSRAEVDSPRLRGRALLGHGLPVEEARFDERLRWMSLLAQFAVAGGAGEPVTLRADPGLSHHNLTPAGRDGARRRWQVCASLAIGGNSLPCIPVH